MLGKILGIASLGEAFINVAMARRFAAHFVVILALILVAVIFASALLIFGFYECHLALIRHGMDPDLAALATGFVGLLILAVLLALIIYKLNIMRTLPLTISRAESMGTNVMSILHGFYKGLTGSSLL